MHHADELDDDPDAFEDDEDDEFDDDFDEEDEESDDEEEPETWQVRLTSPLERA